MGDKRKLTSTVLTLLIGVSTAIAGLSPSDIHQYAGECVVLREQATGLGSYLLYGPEGGMPAAGRRVTPEGRTE